MFKSWKNAGGNLVESPEGIQEVIARENPTNDLDDEFAEKIGRIS